MGTGASTAVPIPSVVDREAFKILIRDNVHVDSYANSSSDDLFSKYAIDGFISKDRLIELVQLEEKYYQ